MCVCFFLLLFFIPLFLLPRRSGGNVQSVTLRVVICRQPSNLLPSQNKTKQKKKRKSVPVTAAGCTYIHLNGAFLFFFFFGAAASCAADDAEANKHIPVSVA